VTEFLKHFLYNRLRYVNDYYMNTMFVYTVYVTQVRQAAINGLLVLRAEMHPFLHHCTSLVNGTRVGCEYHFTSHLYSVVDRSRAGVV